MNVSDRRISEWNTVPVDVNIAIWVLTISLLSGVLSTVIYFSGNVGIASFHVLSLWVGFVCSVSYVSFRAGWVNHTYLQQNPESKHAARADTNRKIFWVISFVGMTAVAAIFLAIV